MVHGEVFILADRIVLMQILLLDVKLLNITCQVSLFLYMRVFIHGMVVLYWALCCNISVLFSQVLRQVS